MKVQKMGFGSDFMQWIGPDMSMKVLLHLDDPADYVRVSAVSASWRQFVIENGLCKQLCLRKFPELSTLAHIELSDVIEPVAVGDSCSMDWENRKRDHRVYAFLAQGLTPVTRKDCIARAICASSTDNSPEESIQNTLEERDRVEDRTSYWSSEGESDSTVPEMLLYKLIANFCIVTEINLQPFQAYFQYGCPIYSPKAVRFRMGRIKVPMEFDPEIADEFAPGQYNVDENFIWSYISPEFSVAQENRLQKFKLPEPVLCVGGILLVELLGRVQTQEMDGLYYICISHVQVVGRALSLPFDVELVGSSGQCALKYCYKSESCTPDGVEAAPSCLGSVARPMQRGPTGWEQLMLNIFPGGEEDSDDD